MPDKFISSSCYILGPIHCPYPLSYLSEVNQIQTGISVFPKKRKINNSNKEKWKIMEAKTLVLREIKWFRLNLYPILEMVK